MKRTVGCGGVTEVHQHIERLALLRRKSRNRLMIGGLPPGLPQTSTMGSNNHEDKVGCMVGLTVCPIRALIRVDPEAMDPVSNGMGVPQIEEGLAVPVRRRL